MTGELWLIRHGETEWTLSGAHTGRTDIALTAEGERKARELGPKLAAHRFSLILTSPMQRARRTCELAGLADQAQIDPDLMEWNYGDYEGLSSADIQKSRPGWTLFRDGVPHGETIDQVASRAEAVIRRAREAGGDVALFAHGHILRILAARWMTLPAVDGRCLALGTASISRLGYEHETPVISLWNQQ